MVNFINGFLATIGKCTWYSHSYCQWQFRCIFGGKIYGPHFWAHSWPDTFNHFITRGSSTQLLICLARDRIENTFNPLKMYGLRPLPLEKVCLEKITDFYGHCLFLILILFIHRLSQLPSHVSDRLSGIWTWTWAEHHQTLHRLDGMVWSGLRFEKSQLIDGQSR